jgi:hypothetical protein
VVEQAIDEKRIRDSQEPLGTMTDREIRAALRGTSDALGAGRQREEAAVVVVDDVDKSFRSGSYVPKTMHAG